MFLLDFCSLKHSDIGRHFVLARFPTFLSTNLISTFCTQFQLFALNFNFLHCLGLIDVLSANEHAEIFVCILLLNEFDGYFLCLSLAKIRDTLPLIFTPFFLTLISDKKRLMLHFQKSSSSFLCYLASFRKMLLIYPVAGFRRPCYISGSLLFCWQAAGREIIAD